MEGGQGVLCVSRDRSTEKTSLGVAFGELKGESVEVKGPLTVRPARLTSLEHGVSGDPWVGSRTLNLGVGEPKFQVWPPNVELSVMSKLHIVHISASPHASRATGHTALTYAILLSRTRSSPDGWQIHHTL